MQGWFAQNCRRQRKGCARHQGLSSWPFGGADLLDESSPAVVKLGGEVIFEDGQFALDGVAQGGFTGTSQLVESRLRATEIKQRAYDELATSADGRKITQRGGEMTFRESCSPTFDQ